MTKTTKFLLIVEKAATSVSDGVKFELEKLGDVTVANVAQIKEHGGTDYYHCDKIVLVGTGTAGPLFDLVFNFVPRVMQQSLFMWTHKQPNISSLKCQLLLPTNVARKVKHHFAPEEQMA